MWPVDYKKAMPAADQPMPWLLEFARQAFGLTGPLAADMVREWKKKEMIFCLEEQPDMKHTGYCFSPAGVLEQRIDGVLVSTKLRPETREAIARYQAGELNTEEVAALVGLSGSDFMVLHDAIGLGRPAQLNS